MDVFAVVLSILIILAPIMIVLYFITKRKLKKTRSELLEKEKEVLEYKNKTNQIIVDIKNEFSEFKEKTEHLKKYETIDDAKDEAERIVNEAKKEFDEIKFTIQIELKESQQKSKEIKDKAELKLTESYTIASKIEEDARAKAEEIAGDAWKAKENAEQYTSTVKAMKNIIKGYGDEYLIPNNSVLDELANEYSHKEAGQELTKIRTLIKSMIKNGEVADCDYVEVYRKTTAIDFAIDAFNGKVDTIMSKVKYDNYGKLLQQLEDAFRLVNHNGKAFRDARITARYYDVIVEQLKMAVAVQELKRIDQEEQKRIKQEMREEEKARREFEKALKLAEKEEKLLQKAMKEAEAKLATSVDEERIKYESQLLELSKKLEEAELKGQRALSMAQQTKQGHVYIISNIGSFGENIFKIGLTRRLEPLDRVKELGDASVPFSFDVHAMIHSDDAPTLEKDLHKIFESNQVNKVNPRKEFFNIPLIDIKEQVESLSVGTNVHWTMKAEALEYRESLEIEKVLN